MKVTDELREWVNWHDGVVGFCRDDLLAIADRIDEACERECEAKVNEFIAKMPDFGEEVAALSDDYLAKHGLVRLPVDANGALLRDERARIGQERRRGGEREGREMMTFEETADEIERLLKEDLDEGRMSPNGVSNVQKYIRLLRDAHEKEASPAVGAPCRDDWAASVERLVRDGVDVSVNVLFSKES